MDSIFNETELAIFFRQTNFNFTDFYRSADGTICALDRVSGQLFSGNDLLRSNVHPLSEIKTVVQNSDGLVSVTFDDSSEISFDTSEGDAEAMLAELREYVQEEAPEIETTVENADDETPETPETPEDPDTSQPTGSDVLMSDDTVLDLVKELKPGDRIHLEYKPLIGKYRAYDAEFVKLEIDTNYASRYFNLDESAEDYPSLMKKVTDALYDYFSIYFSCSESGIEDSCKLKRVKRLDRIG